MLLFRPLKETDEKPFIDLVYSAHAGITSLPKNLTVLKKKIDNSLEAFSKKIWAPDNELYLFVLENQNTGQIIGISGINSQTGMHHPIYYYDVQQMPIDQKIQAEHHLLSQKVLIPNSYTMGPTENCSLFLHPNYRKGGNGKLLSLARFLFIASNRNRFGDFLIANLRGGFKKNGKCPFWELFGRNFWDVEYETLQEKIHKQPEIIPEILPKYPIYLSCLPQEVLDATGQPHKNSIPALKMLLNEGFELLSEIDPFDGGPIVKAAIDAIHFVKYSELKTVGQLSAIKQGEEEVIICNNSLDFRATIATTKVLDNKTIAINQKTAKLLKVNPGDKVRLSSLNRGHQYG